MTKELFVQGWQLYAPVPLKYGTDPEIVAEAARISEKYETVAGKCHASAFVWDCAMVKGLLNAGVTSRAQQHLQIVVARVHGRQYEAIFAQGGQPSCGPRIKQLSSVDGRWVNDALDEYLSWNDDPVAGDIFYNLCVIFEHVKFGRFYEALVATNEVLKSVREVTATK